MEMLVLICEKLWVVMILAAFFICLKRGWLRKGFYLTARQTEEKEAEETEKGKKKSGKRR